MQRASTFAHHTRFLRGRLATNPVVVHKLEAVLPEAMRLKTTLASRIGSGTAMAGMMLFAVEEHQAQEDDASSTSEYGRPEEEVSSDDEINECYDDPHQERKNGAADPPGAQRSAEEPQNEDQNPDEDILDQIGKFKKLPFHEIGGQLTLGTVCGFSSGYALKKVGKIAAVGIGIGFMSIQLLHYYGIIGEVKWDRVQNALVTRLDTDGDGKVTWNDVKHHLRKIVKVLSFNLPSGIGFGLGFYTGLLRG